jgi:phosphoesterase RecJ-like protein
MSTHTHLFAHIHDEIRKADRILLVAHKKPDGDTLGSSSSVLNWLLREGKQVEVFCADLPPQMYRYIDNIHRYTADPNIFAQKFDLVLVFDSGDLRYCGIDQFVPNLPKPYTLVNFDHHATNNFFADINLVITEASSTAEVIFRLYEEGDIALDPKMATSLLTGLLTDTSNFSNAATNPKAMEAASKLLSAGARFQDVLTHTLHDKSIDTLKVWGLMLSRLRHNPTYDVVSTYIRTQDLGGLSKDIVEGASNFLNAVTSGTDTILVLHELPNGTVKGSFRSVNRDISAVAKLLGGGGHKKAAGFTVAGRIEETMDGPRIVN